MDLTTQIAIFWFLVLANSHFLSAGSDDPGPLDIFDPLHLIPHRGHGLLDLPGPRHHHSHHHLGHTGTEKLLNPSIGPLPLENLEYNNKNQDKGIKDVTESSPLKVTLLLEADIKNNTVKIDVNEQQKESEISKGNSSILPQLLSNEDHILRTNKNKTMSQKDISKFRDISTMGQSLNITQNNIEPGDKIVFPDDFGKVKPAHKGENENLNKWSNLSRTYDDKTNYTKNTDTTRLPLQIVPIQVSNIPTANSVQATNGNMLLVSLIPSDNSRNTANEVLPKTNDVFPNRPYTAVYPIAGTGQGPLYTNVANSFPQNGGQTLPAVVQQQQSCCNNNNFGNTVSVFPQNVPSASIYQNLNQNVGVVNPLNNVADNSAMNLGQNPQNTLAMATMIVNPISVNDNYQQPNYNGQYYPANNVQSNNHIQPGQTLPSGAISSTFNQESILGQGNINPAPNFDGNTGQTFNTQNGGQTYVPNNVQQKIGQLYTVPNNNQFNNIIGQLLALTPQGNILTTNSNSVLPDNTQKYMLVNMNQQNVRQNGQTNGIPSLQNGQLVTLIPHQVSNGFVNNNVLNGQMTPILNNNIGQSMNQNPNVNPQPNPITTDSYANIPTSNLVGQSMNQNPNVNPQPNPITTDSYANIPTSNLVLMNGNVPNNVIFANDQANLRKSDQNSHVSGPLGRNLYTLVTMPNGYVPNNNNNNNQIQSSVNLVNTKDKEENSNST